MKARKNGVHILLGIFMLVSLNHCATLWQPAGGNLSTGQWAVEAPQEWMLLETGEYHMLSKDGPYLQYLLIQARPLEKKFRHTRSALNAGMLPHEAAETIIADLRADPAIRNLRVIDNTPAIIDGQMGFKLNYTYEGPMGVEMQTHLYGVITPPYYFTLRYTAAKRHYFEQDLAAFEKVLKSLELKKAYAGT